MAAYANASKKRRAARSPPRMSNTPATNRADFGRIPLCSDRGAYSHRQQGLSFL